MEFKKNKLVFKTIDSISEWERIFEILRHWIVSEDQARTSENYKKERFDLKKQDEMTLAFFEGQIMAFSSLYSNPELYGQGVSRALNRLWKEPSIRSITEPYSVFPKEMLRLQIEAAKRLNKKALFISTEGVRKRWLGKWVDNANLDFPGWVLLEGMHKVAPNNISSSWQNVAWYPIEDNAKPNFIKISDQEWRDQFRH